MTTREELIYRLSQCAVPTSMWIPISDYCIPKVDALDKSYNITWNRPCEEYPHVMRAMLFNMAKPFILEWLNKNEPQAWFKPLFDDNAMKEIMAKVTS